MTKIINRTGHDINLNNGVTIKPELDENGNTIMTTVNASYSDFDENLVCDQVFGEIKNLPEQKDGILYAVSAITLAAAKKLGRSDFIAPATGHPSCKRNEKGAPISVPGFVR